MNKKIIFFLLLFSFLGSQVAFSQQIQKGEILTLQRCIKIALKNHPSINAAQQTVRIYESRIGQARAGYMPQLTFQSDYQRVGPASLSGQDVDPYNQYSNTLNLSQTLFDFGKTCIATFTI